MTHKERIALYLSGNLDKKTEVQIENALTEDDNLLNQFIEASEQAIHTAPTDFAGAVMRMIGTHNISGASTTVPVLSRKMRAAVCFCSAAAIILFTVTGFDRRILEFVTNNFDRFNELLNAIKTF